MFHKKLQNEPRTSSQCDHFIEPSAEKLVDTSITFLQDGPCFKVAPKLVKCRECTKLSNQHSHQVSNEFCRFHGFRRLRYKTNGQLAISGFSDPVTDASEVKVFLCIRDYIYIILKILFIILRILLY